MSEPRPADRVAQPRPRQSPWLMRTYSGHSTAVASNELYRTNLAKGQTGLSIAFDLPTQTGYDPDAPEAAGEVGKVGVPVAHLGHMAELLAGIPLGEMNTSMTINATAAWLFGLYVAHATATGVDPARLAGTTQNDIVKEYLSRGTYIFGPEASRRLTVDTIAWAAHHAPRWNPINVCSYHLQEAGATPVQELAYALATAIGVLDAVLASGQIDPADFPAVVGRISFFVNAGIRFVEETCKMRAFTRLWDRICADRYRVQDPKLRRFRYGVQVNSLGLTESQPENNVPRIVLETLGVTLSAGARARAVQLPAWNEALGLPRPWDQQWSLRIQQVLAYETDLLEYDDIFEGSKVIEARTDELMAAATAELDQVLALGGVFSETGIGEVKSRLVRSQVDRTRRIESGELPVVGVNVFTTTEPSPLDGNDLILRVDPAQEAALVAALSDWRAGRSTSQMSAALDQLRRAAEDGSNIMPATIALAQAGGTTGEWADTLRGIFGQYRAPTGVSGALGLRRAELSPVRAHVAALAAARGGPPRILVAKPGLDGHSNGAEQIAVAARDAGFEVVYQGIRSSPAEIAAAARDEDVDLVGISILSGSHLSLVPEVMKQLAAAGVSVPVVVGGIIPATDADELVRGGVAAVYTPRDFEVTRIVAQLADLIQDELPARVR
ncbi:MAG: methylmalonyl-CoA mutase family protein [Actinomycetota bacterium]|nr:methylmalonyl-CoA mutase family protein [Actinomycetota bacterium]